MIIETERVILNPFTSLDLEIFHQTNTHPFVRKYLWDDRSISRDTSKEILRKTEQYFITEKWGLWKLIRKEDEAYMGYSGLWYFFEELQPQLIYALLPEFTGQGYATEAAKAVIKYAFDELQFKYLVASTDPPNESSKKVCERLEMEFLENRTIDGKSTTFYELINKDS